MSRAPAYTRSDRVVYRHIAGEDLLIDLKSKADIPYFALTPSAVHLWGELEGWRTEEELVAGLLERYEVSGEQAAGDVKEFLAQLESIGAVQRQDGPA